MLPVCLCGCVAVQKASGPSSGRRSFSCATASSPTSATSRQAAVRCALKLTRPFFVFLCAVVSAVQHQHHAQQRRRLDHRFEHFAAPPCLPDPTDVLLTLFCSSESILLSACVENNDPVVFAALSTYRVCTTTCSFAAESAHSDALLALLMCLRSARASTAISCRRCSGWASSGAGAYPLTHMATLPLCSANDVFCAF